MVDAVSSKFQMVQPCYSSILILDHHIGRTQGGTTPYLVREALQVAQAVHHGDASK
jgi:hypothetical protein